MQLEQLAIRYAISSYSCLYDARPTFQQNQNILVTLPALRSLHFLNYLDDDDLEAEAAKLRDLQSIATQFFAEGPKLKALGFRTAG